MSLREKNVCFPLLFGTLKMCLIRKVSFMRGSTNPLSFAGSFRELLMFQSFANYHSSESNTLPVRSTCNCCNNCFTLVSMCFGIFVAFEPGTCTKINMHVNCWKCVIFMSKLCIYSHCIPCGVKNVHTSLLEHTVNF